MAEDGGKRKARRRSPVESDREPTVPQVSSEESVAERAPIIIRSHRSLVTHTQEIISRLNADPGLSRFLLINPVLMFKELNVSLSPAIAHHVLVTAQYPSGLGTRRQQLETQIEHELGEPPQLDKPHWISRFLFEHLGLQPLDTRGRVPTYVPSIDPEAMQRLQALRPQSSQSTDGDATPIVGTTVQLQDGRPAARLMDLNATVPELKVAPSVPDRVDLEALYFYKDKHPLARAALELGIIQRQALPIHSSGGYRRIRQGEKRNALNEWVKAVRFNKD